VGLSPLNLTSTNMTKTEIFSVQGQAAMWVWVLWTNMAKTEIFSVQGQAAMWVWVL
jgi:hypothetical protein